MELLQGIHSRLDAQQSDLEYLKGSKEGTTTDFGAISASSQQLGGTPKISTSSITPGIDELADDV